jgi:DNA-binding NarL/FixJ family response regulator
MDKQIRVVIADDHPLFLRGLREVLESDRAIAVVGEAKRGEDAIDLIHRVSPHIAILDIDMKHVGGLDVARRVSPLVENMEVIFLTMHKEADLFEAAMNIGALGYVVKDSAVDEILDAVHAVAAGRYFVSSALSDLLVRRRERADESALTASPVDALSPAELRVLRLIAESNTSKEIGEALFISPKTVENHRTNIAQKLNLRGSHSLLKFAIEHKTSLTSR